MLILQSRFRNKVIDQCKGVISTGERKSMWQEGGVKQQLMPTSVIVKCKYMHWGILWNYLLFGVRCPGCHGDLKSFVLVAVFLAAEVYSCVSITTHAFYPHLHSSKQLKKNCNNKTFGTFKEPCCFTIRPVQRCIHFMFFVMEARIKMKFIGNLTYLHFLSLLLLNM